MDAYHLVLAKLYEATEGKDTKAVDFKELVRTVGYFGNYPDIFERLSREGWIAEDKKADFVRITHWGISEVKKSPTESLDKAGASISVDINKAGAEAKELTLLLEILGQNASKENVSAVEKKLSDLTILINHIKANLQ